MLHIRPFKTFGSTGAYHKYYDIYRPIFEGTYLIDLKTRPKYSYQFDLETRPEYSYQLDLGSSY